MLQNLFARLYHTLPVIRELDRAVQRLAGIESAITRLSSLQARQFLEWQRSIDPRYADPKRLLSHSFQVCSQSGEDGIIQEIFRRIGTTNQVFFESGVGDGIENNTAFLLSLGWTGYWVDANPKFLTTLNRTAILDSRKLQRAVSMLTKENCVSLLSELGVPRDFDLLSLDVDQNTYHVWRALGEHFHPRAIVIEYNGVVPPHIEWVVQYDPERVWNWTHNFGASLKAYENLGRQFGYFLVGCDPIGANAFFVKSEFVENNFAEPFTAENHFEPARYHLIHRMGLANEILDSRGRD
jgi:hypothetical protein